MRVTTKMDADLKIIIQEMADKNNWPFDYMCYVLLQQAVKEKTRPRRGNKQDNSENIAQNMGKGNKE